MVLEEKKEDDGFDKIFDTILKAIEENKEEMAPKQPIKKRQLSIRDKARREATKKLIPRARIRGIIR
ncbi:MAG: hypothetical protein JRI35_02955 [Deltaproteobacteria bacterium]|nr:hypothetical protein [Deltaproteobacteria bacterium]